MVNDLGGAVDGSGDDRSPAQQVVDEITAMGAEAVANDDDIADWEGGRRLIEAAVDAFGDFHVLVNNAGILRDKMLVNMSAEDWDSVIHVHLKGHFVPTRHAAAYWREQVKDGRQISAAIVNTSSTSGLLGNPGQTKRRRQSGDRRLHRDRRPGALPLRRPGERHRPGRPHPHDRADTGSGRHREGAEGPGQVRHLGSGQCLAPGGLSLDRELSPHRSGPLRPGRQVRLFQNWTMTETLQKDDRWTVAELAERLPAVVGVDAAG